MSSETQEKSYDEQQKELRKNIRKVFRDMDVNGTGTLSATELLRAANCLGIYMTKSQSKQCIEKNDKDDSGNISYKEFEDVMLEYYGLLEYQNRALIDAFHKFDKDESGFIDKNELSKCLCNCGEAFSPEEVKEFFELGDSNKDGQLCIEEFVALLTVEPNVF